MFKYLMFSTAIIRAPEGDPAGGGGDPAGGTNPNPTNNADPAAGGGDPAGGAIKLAAFPNATPEDVTYLQAKGWDKSTAPAEDILKSYRHLEKLQGAITGGKAIIPPDENADQAAKDAFFNKLGRPETVEGYELAEPFKGMSPELSADLTKVGHEIGLTKTQLAALHKWNNEKTDEVAAAFEADYKIENAQQVGALKTEWGAAFEANVQYAKEAATKLGWTEDQIKNMQIGLGYDGVMKLAHSIGKAIGEGSFVSSGGTGTGRGGSDNVMTPAQAQAELSRLGQDASFTAAWMDKANVGHAAAVAKKTQLTKWAYPDSK